MEEHAEGGGGANSKNKETGNGVLVAYFDPSVENFLSYSDSVAALCGQPSKESFEPSEVESFSSNVTFLKEWNRFVYEPKSVKFAYQTGPGQFKQELDEISLPQFSSAAIAKIEQSPGGAKSFDGTDFVLNAGGFVWALDWCPKGSEVHESSIQCEYLAVAAHPPGSSYHQIGLPLFGRGVIQIWCLLTVRENMDFSQLWKGRVRKNMVQKPTYDSEGKEVPTMKRPRGRPRKQSMIGDGQDGLENMDFSQLWKGRVRKNMVQKPTYDSEGKEVPTMKRSRGRPKKPSMIGNDQDGLKETIPMKSTGMPKKKPNLDLTNENQPFVRPRNCSSPCINDLDDKSESPLSSNNLILGTNEHTTSVGNSEGVAMGTPTLGCLNGKVGTVASRSRGRPRKSLNPFSESQTYSSTPPPSRASDISSKSLVVLPKSFDLNGNPFGKIQGRTRKELKATVNRCVQISDFEFGENISALPTSGEFDTSSKNIVALPDSSDLNGNPCGKRRRGRPRKELKATLNSSSNFEFAENISALATPTGPETSGEDMELLQTLDQYLHSSVNNHRRRARKGQSSTIKKYIQASESERGKDLSTLPTSIGPEIFNGNGESFPILNGNMVLSVNKRGGRPARRLKEAVKKCDQLSGSELGEHVFSPTTSNQPGTFSKNVDPLPEFNLHGNIELSSKRPRGRPKKGLGPNTDKCTQESGFQLGETTSQHTLPGLGSLSENVESLPIADDLSNKVESSGINSTEDSFAIPTSQEETLSKNYLAFSLSADSKGNLKSTGPIRRGSAIKNKKKAPKNSVQGTCVGPEEDLSTLPASRALGTPSEEVIALPAIADSNDVKECKELVETVVPTSGFQSKGEMVLRREVTQEIPLMSDHTSLPKLVLCVGHMGKVAWDVKWRPIVNESEGKHHLGYLAVLLGDGSLEVWEIPLPSMIHMLYTSFGNKGYDPRFLKLKPIFRCSKVNFGNNQSIPLTMEWSTTAPHDLLLAGCHDGTVALWKFSKQHSSQDIKPLICFSTDSFPIRALAWAPDQRDAENANLVVTAANDSLKFWDLRDPYRPLWEMNPVVKMILSVDWLKEPRCIMWSYDDGTVRMLSLCKAVNDVAVTGEPSFTTKQPGVHCFSCSHSAVWSFQASRATGVVAYCTADGSACYFQLTSKMVEKDANRHRKPHFLCGSFTKEEGVLKVNTPLSNCCLPRISSTMKHTPNEFGNGPQTLCSYLAGANQARPTEDSAPDDPATSKMKTTSTLRKCGNKKSGPTTSTLRKCENKKSGSSRPLDEPFMIVEEEEGTTTRVDNRDASAQKTEVLPPRDVALHRVRWNMNKGSVRWLCYGGAAGIIRCQAIPLPDT